MSSGGDDVPNALEALGVEVAERLSDGGWRRRLLPEFDAITLTRPSGNGILAVVEIDRTSFRLPDGWPVEFVARLGVGFEPALNLMPLLTLPPRARLVHHPEHGRRNAFTAELDGPTSVHRVAERIAQYVTGNTAAVTQSFPDGDAIDAQLRHELEETCTSTDAEGGGGINPTARDFSTRQRLVVLAAMGRHDDVRDLLASFPVDLTDGAVRSDDRRFIRQLGRWLDAGGPAAPPIEQTLALLPRRTRESRPSRSDAFAKTKADQAAFDAARAGSPGKTLEQLRESIASEYASRGIDLAPSAVHIKAQILLGERQPFGRARQALHAVRMVTQIGANLIQTVRHGDERDPDWLRAPDRAAYPILVGRHRYTEVDVEPDARDWLDRVHAESPRRAGPFVRVDAWLTQAESGTAPVVHIGVRRVGTVIERDASAYDPSFRAARLFDEDPLVDARLLRTDAGDDVLEIRLPEMRSGSSDA